MDEGENSNFYSLILITYLAKKKKNVQTQDFLNLKPKKKKKRKPKWITCLFIS